MNASFDDVMIVDRRGRAGAAKSIFRRFVYVFCADRAVVRLPGIVQCLEEQPTPAGTCEQKDYIYRGEAVVAGREIPSACSPVDA